MAEHVTAIILGFIGTLPLWFAWVSTRKKTAQETTELASTTTRSEFHTLYAEARLQLVEIRTAYTALREECKGLGKELETERAAVAAHQREIEQLRIDLAAETQERERLEWVVRKLEEKDRDRVPRNRPSGGGR